MNWFLWSIQLRLWHSNFYVLPWLSIDIVEIKAQGAWSASLSVSFHCQTLTIPYCLDSGLWILELPGMGEYYSILLNLQDLIFLFWTPEIARNYITSECKCPFCYPFSDLQRSNLLDPNSWKQETVSDCSAIPFGFLRSNELLNFPILACSIPGIPKRPECERPLIYLNFDFIISDMLEFLGWQKPVSNSWADTFLGCGLSDCLSKFPPISPFIRTKWVLD